MWKLSIKNNSGLVKQGTGKGLKLEVLSRIKIVVLKGLIIFIL